MARSNERATIVRVVAFIILIYYVYVLLKTSIFTRLFSKNLMRGLELTPFKSLAFTADAFKDPAGIFRSTGFKTLSGPVFMFLPLGFLLPFVNPQLKRYINILGITAALSLSIEILQYITKTGISSIDDLLLNIIGASLGFLIYKILRFAFVNS